VNGSLVDSIKFVQKAFSGANITGNCKAVGD